MTWVKKGLVFAPAAGSAWQVSHLALPVVEARPNGHRVYYTARDGLGRSQIGAFDADFSRPGETSGWTAQPLIGLGPLGAFDDSGVTSSCLVRDGSRLLHYYTGWTLGGTVPFHLAIGLAVSEDEGETFRKVSRAPILGRTDVDPYLAASPCVLMEGGRFRMWYVSGTGWTMEGGKPKHAYHIRYAESADGIGWEARGQVAIDYEHPGEHALSRPCVVRDPDCYRMWYSWRGTAYRLGYAESADGLVWKRKDAEAGLEASAAGWDAEMIAYPWVFDTGGRRLMLYNGNGYGRTGIGLAVWGE